MGGWGGNGGQPGKGRGILCVMCKIGVGPMRRLCGCMVASFTLCLPFFQRQPGRDIHGPVKCTSARVLEGVDGRVNTHGHRTLFAWVTGQKMRYVPLPGTVRDVSPMHKSAPLCVCVCVAFPTSCVSRIPPSGRRGMCGFCFAALYPETPTVSYSATPPPPFRSPELPERAGTFCRNVVVLGGSMFFSENTCCYCQPLSSTLPVTLLFVHPLAEMLKCCTA